MQVTLTLKQSDVWVNILENPNKRRILLDGGARSSKTTLILAWMLSQLRYKGIRMLAVRKHRISAKNSLWNDTIKWLCQGNPYLTLTDNDLTITHKTTGGTLRIDGLDDQDRAEKILGTGYCHIFCNEATQLAWPTVQLAMSRLSQDVDGVAARKMIFDCNPSAPSSWLYRVGIEHRNPDDGSPLVDAHIWARQNFIPSDNPHLPADALATLNALTGIARKRFLEGIWVKAEGLVYPNWDENTMVRHRDTDSAKAFIISIDTGLNDPVVCSLFAIYPDDSMHLCGLKYIQGKLLTTTISDLIECWRGLSPVVVVDPSSSGTIIELGAKGWTVNPAMNKLLPGIQAVTDAIKQGKISIEPELSEMPCKELNAYTLDPKTGLPEKGCLDHWLDTARYGIFAVLGSKKQIIRPTIIDCNGNDLSQPLPKPALKPQEQLIIDIGNALQSDTGSDGWH